MLHSSIRKDELGQKYIEFVGPFVIIIIIIIIISSSSSSSSSSSGRLCGLVVRVSGYRYRGLGFDSRRYQSF